MTDQIGTVCHLIDYVKAGAFPASLDLTKMSPVPGWWVQRSKRHPADLWEIWVNTRGAIPSTPPDRIVARSQLQRIAMGEWLDDALQFVGELRDPDLK